MKQYKVYSIDGRTEYAINADYFLFEMHEPATIDFRNDTDEEGMRSKLVATFVLRNIAGFEEV